MVDVDGDGIDDAKPRWVVTILYAVAITLSIVIIGVYIGHGSYELIVNDNPTFFPDELAIGAIVALLGLVAMNRKD